MHPSRMNDLGIRSDGNVFRNHAESRASFGEAFSEIRLAGELVFENVVKRHAVGVFAGSGGERFIPLEGGQRSLGALAIGSIEESAFIVGKSLRSERRRDEKNYKKSCGQENSGFPHGSTTYPRTCTALKLRITWPPAVGRPKLNMGLKREKSSI